MKIKEKKYQNRLYDIFQKIRIKKISIFFVYTLIIFFTGVISHKSLNLGGKIGNLRLTISKSIKKIENQISYFLNTPKQKLEKVTFDIKYDDYQKLMYWRSLSLENYSLNMVDHKFISANMIYNDKTIPVKVRLRGGTANEHQAGEKWSFRVQIKGNNRLFGMKSFSLMNPERRNFLMEWLLRKILKEEGVISKKYGFLNIVINGKYKGIYAFDEHFSKEMIENNKRREGPIIRFSDDSFWFEKAAYKQHPSEWGDYYFSAYVDAIESKNYSDNILFQEASDIINSFRRGELKTSEVFDVEKLSKSMAIGDLLGAWHGFIVFNSKFYYNPITKKLEPIPDDSFTESRSLRSNIFRLNDKYITGSFLEQVFNDINFTKKYLEEINRVTKYGYLDSMLNKFDYSLINNTKALQNEYPIYELPRDEIYINLEMLRQTLNPTRAILAYFSKENDDNIILNIATTKNLPVELINVKYDNEFILRPESKIILKGRDYKGILNYTENKFFFPKLLKKIKSKSSLEVTYKILGKNELKTEKILTYKSYDIDRLSKNIKLLKSNSYSFDFLKVDSLNKEIIFKIGNWKLDKNLIIPKDYILIAEPATSLDFINSSLIISNSPIRFEGTEHNPIILSSSDKTGKGLAVFSNGRKSKLENVIIKDMNIFPDSVWHRTGAITFYESPVYINNSHFYNIKAEDALNIINAEFSIENVIFKNSSSDAFDADFCNGAIINSKFINSGNDAIDVSGSNIRVDKITINEALDKGISIGEESTALIKNSDIKYCKVAIAVKDESKSDINNLGIYDCDYGITGYQKKIEFNHPKIIANSIKFTNVINDYLIEEKTSVIIDNINIPSRSKNVYKTLYK